METQLEQLVLLTEYRSQRRHLFPSPSSLDWFLRKHRSGLVRAGALLLHTGRWFAAIDKFDAYVVDAGTQAARQQA